MGDGQVVSLLTLNQASAGSNPARPRPTIFFASTWRGLDYTKKNNIFELKQERKDIKCLVKN